MSNITIGRSLVHLRTRSLTHSLILFIFKGKFGQNTDKTQTAFVNFQEDLENLLYNPQLIVKNVALIDNSIMQVNYVNKVERVVHSRTTNTIHAAFCTSMARIQLDIGKLLIKIK
jgi:hypothetical protein